MPLLSVPPAPTPVLQDRKGRGDARGRGRRPGRGGASRGGRGRARRRAGAGAAVRRSSSRWSCAAALPPGSLTGLRRPGRGAGSQDAVWSGRALTVAVRLRAERREAGLRGARRGRQRRCRRRGPGGRACVGPRAAASTSSAPGRTAQGHGRGGRGSGKGGPRAWPARPRAPEGRGPAHCAAGPRRASGPDRACGSWGCGERPRGPPGPTGPGGAGDGRPRSGGRPAPSSRSARPRAGLLPRRQAGASLPQLPQRPGGTWEVSDVDSAYTEHPLCARPSPGGARGLLPFVQPGWRCAQPGLGMISVLTANMWDSYYYSYYFVQKRSWRSSEINLPRISERKCVKTVLTVQ